MVVAAGNETTDACSKSPASAPAAITVAATTSTDARASYSNYGTCVDIFAPGSAITSSWYTSTTATNTISGTSMASPHVAGVAALLISTGVTQPSEVATALNSQATTGVVTLLGTGSPDRLLYSGSIRSSTSFQTVAIPSAQTRGVKVSSKAWQANATVTVKTFDGFNFSASGVASAMVSASFSPGGIATCVTDALGTCVLKSANISLSTIASDFTVTGVAGAGLVYDSTKSIQTTRISRP